MWAQASASKMNKDGSFCVNDEYLHAFRTESYVELFTKAQLLVNEPPSSSTNILLEPEQRLLPPILQTFSKHSPDLKSLMLRYFETSAQGSAICSKLLSSINEAHANYTFIQRALHCSPEQYSSAISELDSFSYQRNPFSNPNPEDFKQICGNFSSILHCLKSKRKTVARKIKLIEFIKKALGACLTVTCIVFSLVAIGIAVHSISGHLVIGPASLCIPPVQLKEKKFSSMNCFKCTSLRKLRKQLDIAARGTYILNRDFDTVSRIVVRLHDEVEHKKEMIRFCLERRGDRFPLEEVVKEFQRNGRGFEQQVEELEDQVCLCLVTINRARVLVMKEMAKP